SVSATARWSCLPWRSASVSFLASSRSPTEMPSNGLGPERDGPLSDRADGADGAGGGGSAGGAGGRLRRLLAILVHLANAGEASIEDLARRFDMEPQEMVAEL